MNKKLSNILSKPINLLKKFKKNKKDNKHYYQSINFNSLPEKKDYSIQLNKILTFGFLFRIGLILLLIAYIGYIGIQSLDIIYTILTAFIISIAIETFIKVFEKILPREASIIFAYIGLFIFLTLGFILLIPFVFTNLSQILNIILNKINSIQTQLQTQSLEELVKSLHLYPFLKDKLLTYISNPDIANKIREILTTNISNILQTLAQSLKEISSFAIYTVTAFFNTISQILIIFILAIFFSFEKEKVVYTLANLSQKPKKTAKKLDKLYFQLGEWLKGQLLLGIFIGIAVYLGLWTLALFGINLESKITLAIIAGLMEFLPYLGPILGALPALLVSSIAYGFSGFIWVGILFIIIQQVEGWIVPVIMNKALGVSPLLILICMLFGMKILGFLGIILAIPLAVIISLMFEEQLTKK